MYKYYYSNFYVNNDMSFNSGLNWFSAYIFLWDVLPDVNMSVFKQSRNYNWNFSRNFCLLSTVLNEIFCMNLKFSLCR